MPAFFIKLTPTGAAKIAAWQAGGPEVSLTHIAVGDGNGNPIEWPPTGDLPTMLVREVHREQIAAIYVTDEDPTIFVAEMTIPSEEGGWTIREIGVFDVDGEMFAYGNFPESYKPIGEEGSTREMVIKAGMKVASTEAIQLVIDANVVLASREWVLSYVTGAYLIPGGLTDQYLAKASNTDGDFEWRDLADGINVVVNVIQEVQTLADSQTVVNLVDVNTSGGLGVYVEGVRLIYGIGEDYTHTGDDGVQITLASSYPAGTKIHMYMNDPTGTADFLRPENNLSDVNDPDESLTNIGGWSKAKHYFMSQI